MALQVGTRMRRYFDGLRVESDGMLRGPRSGSGIGVEVDVRHVGRLAQVCGSVKGAHDLRINGYRGEE